MRSTNRSVVAVSSLVVIGGMMAGMNAASQNAAVRAGKEYVPPPAPAPVLTLIPSSQKVQPNENVHVTATWDHQVRPLDYYFVWGDGNTSGPTRGESDHAYSSPGTYTVQVRPRPPAGVESFDISISAEATITVELPPAQPPAPAPRQPPKLTVTLDGKVPLVTKNEIFVRAYLDPPHRAATYTFNWGDGLPIEAAGSRGISGHRYARPGFYNVVVSADVHDRGLPPIVGVLPLRILGPTIWPQVAGWAAAVAAFGFICWGASRGFSSVR